MLTGRTFKLLVLSTSFAAALVGCAIGASTQAPEGVRLDGTWKLDRSASDDPQKVIDKLREAAAKIASRRPPQGSPGLSGMGRGGRRGPPGQLPPQEDDAGLVGPHGVDLLEHSLQMQTLRSFVARGDYLMVQQEPERFLLDYGGSGRSFTPGERSVVSAETGVADQVSGWRGKEYVIDVKPQIGPSISEAYSLSPDHQHLIAHLHVDSSDLPKVDLTQVYDRTTQIAPRTVPSTD
jgi:hypothetical protein